MTNNQAFIDAQNLYLDTIRAAEPWILDLARFRVYLEREYRVDKAYYFAGAYMPSQRDLYDFIKRCGYILRFTEQMQSMIDVKKGNVEADIVFLIMKKLYNSENFGKVVLVSGGGDYGQLVRFLIEEGRFEKLLVLKRVQMLSLYEQIDVAYKDVLGSMDERFMLEYKRCKK
jgi:hypothetical protein